MTTKTCPICDSAFECRGISLRNPCWCLRVEVTPEHRKEIAHVTNECVCENCLSGKKKRP